MKTYRYATTKVHLVKQKAGPELGGMKKTVLSWQVGSIIGNRYLILVGELQLTARNQTLLNLSEGLGLQQ